MKSLSIWLVILLSLLNISASAQKKPTSSIRFSTSNQEPISVILNDRDFNRIGKVIVFNDLPKKRQRVQMYAITQDRTGRKKGNLIYSGNIKLEPGKKYDAVLDLNTHKLRLKAVRDFPVITSVERKTNTKTQSVEYQKSSEGLNNSTATDSATIQLTSAMKSLKVDMDKSVIDKDKIAKAQKFSTQYKLNCAEAKEIANWLNFDDSKLTFLVSITDKVSDPQNLSSISDIFTYESNKKVFLESIPK